MAYDLRPLHISSEAPEVVPEEQSPYLTSPDKYFVRSYSMRRASQSLISPSRKRYNNIDTQEFPPPRRAYDLARYYQQPTPPRQRKKFGLIPLVLVSIAAFFIGGGVGGGIGGWVGKHLNSSSTSNSGATRTNPSCPSSTTFIVDSAGCPLVNGKNYTTSSPVATFLIACQTDLKSNPGENIELANVTTGTLEACMDACAAYNNGQCLAATWIQFSPTSPQLNSKCFFKANIGVPMSVNSTGTTATSAYRLSRSSSRIKLNSRSANDLFLGDLF